MRVHGIWHHSTDIQQFLLAETRVVQLARAAGVHSISLTARIGYREETEWHRRTYEGQIKIGRVLEQTATLGVPENLQWMIARCSEFHTYPAPGIVMGVFMVVVPPLIPVRILPLEEIGLLPRLPARRYASVFSQSGQHSNRSSPRTSRTPSL